MNRNTDIGSILFPVGYADVFMEGVTGESIFQPVKIPVEKYRAIVDQQTGNVICVVSKDYKLITNEEALELGKECYKQVFNMTDTKDFEIFNIITSSLKTICHIDVIQKGYEINIFKQEVYLPYIRITNSYNRTKLLSFDVGFCRKLCSNGVIFEKETIKFTYSHTKQSIKEKIQFEILPDKLETMKRNFIDYTNKLSDFAVPKNQAIPLMCKIIDMRFNLDKKDEELEKEIKRLDEFKKRAYKLVNEYYNLSGPNAYAVFNVCTDFATHSKSGNVNYFADGLQKRIGNWTESFPEECKNKDFSLEKYIGEYGKYLN